MKPWNATWAIKATPSSTADYEKLTANDSALLDFLYFRAENTTYSITITNNSWKKSCSTYSTKKRCQIVFPINHPFLRFACLACISKTGFGHKSQRAFSSQPNKGYPEKRSFLLSPCAMLLISENLAFLFYCYCTASDSGAQTAENLYIPFLAVIFLYGNPLSNSPPWWHVL